jgi:hypothetical protein
VHKLTPEDPVEQFVSRYDAITVFYQLLERLGYLRLNVYHLASLYHANCAVTSMKFSRWQLNPQHV